MNNIHLRIQTQVLLCICICILIPPDTDIGRTLKEVIAGTSSISSMDPPPQGSFSVDYLSSKSSFNGGV